MAFFYYAKNIKVMWANKKSSAQVSRDFVTSHSLSLSLGGSFVGFAHNSFHFWSLIAQKKSKMYKENVALVYTERHERALCEANRKFYSDRSRNWVCGMRKFDQNSVATYSIWIHVPRSPLSFEIVCVVGGIIRGRCGVLVELACLTRECQCGYGHAHGIWAWRWERRCRGVQRARLEIDDS